MREPRLPVVPVRMMRLGLAEAQRFEEFRRTWFMFDGISFEGQSISRT